MTATTTKRAHAAPHELPWSLGENGKTILDRKGFHFATCQFKTRAPFIVQSANSFHAMREALKQAEIHLEYLVENFRPHEGIGHPINALRDVRAALALCGERQ